MTTAICFDLDGTLVGYDRSFDAVTAAALETGLGTAPEALVGRYTDAFLDAFRALEPDPYHAGMAAALKRVRETGPVPDRALADVTVDELVAAHAEAELAATTVTPAARDCLDAFAADAETRVAVVTDGVGDRQRRKLTHHGLDDAAEETVVSYDVGGHKRSGEPYAAVRERLPADEYVMVGDSYESDVEAARAAGFVPVHYEDDGADLFEILRAFL